MKPKCYYDVTLADMTKLKLETEEVWKLLKNQEPGREVIKAVIASASPGTVKEIMDRSKKIVRISLN